MACLRCSLIAAVALTTLSASAADWPRFRGPAGNGVAEDSESLPTKWSPDANLAWKTPLPGPGASSPIIVVGKVFVTCYSGYGLDQRNPGDMENLVRHLVCLDLQTGKKLWQKDVKAVLPEDPYTGAGVPAHGYASHTPVSDGKNVYAFFGKSGVHAFDMKGEELWNTEVGKESDPTRWGSSSSPIIHGNTVIVTASAESQAIVGLDKETGKELWRQEAEGLDGMWGTPTLVETGEGRTDLVMCVAKELWGLDPSSGKLRWFANATGAEHAYSSVVVDGQRVYAVTGRGGGSVAVNAGGNGDVSQQNTIWTGRDTSSFASPILHQGKLYSVARGVVTVMDARSGKRQNQIRLRGVERTGGRFGSLDYPSPVIVGDRMFSLNGTGQMFVLALGEKPEQVAINRVTKEKEAFRGTPAVSNGRMVLRSSKFAYCVADKGETVKESDQALAKADEENATESAPRRGRFDVMSMFNRMDTDKDGKVTMAELKGNRMADRLKTLDKDGDKAISKEEFRTGIASLFSRGSRGYGRGKDTRPDRPQRPEFSKN